jgi:hypothetical protein
MSLCKRATPHATRLILCGVVLCAVFLGCGRTAPEPFWQPTKDDSAGIASAIEQNKALFATGLAELALTFCDTTLPGTTAVIFRKEVKGNPFKQRFRLDSLQHVFDTAAYDLEYTFTANVDSVLQPDSTIITETTCTVTLAETIPGTLYMHAWRMTDSLRESIIIVPPNETLRLPLYDTVATDCDTVITKPIAGASVDGCVLKKTGGQWELWKVGGGSRFYAPGPDDAPYIVSFYLASRDRVDTVFLRPDTLHYGIQRFYTFATGGQLLTFDTTDFVKVSKVTTVPGDFGNYVYLDNHRVELSDTIRFSAADTGLHRLYLEQVPAAMLWEVKGKYVATVWGVPIRVVGGAK